MEGISLLDRYASRRRCSAVTLQPGARRREDKKSRMLGSTTDGFGIVSEVKKTCLSRPWMTLANATALTYY
jgi:hypothetical protein